MKNHDFEALDVAVFNARIGTPVPSTVQAPVKVLALQQLELLEEEVRELRTAIENDDFVGTVHETLDVVYVAKGFAALTGIVYCWRDLWRELHRANLSKDGQRTERKAFDAVKPAGWKPANFVPILRRFGWLS